MAEHSVTAGEKLPMATQSSPEMLQRLDLMVRILLVSRYLFALLGLAFFLWEGVEVFWMHEDLTWAVMEVALISVLGLVLVWVSSSWALRLARDASRTHRQIQHEIAERTRAEEALRLHGEVVANMAEGVCLIRARDGVIVYANSKFEEMFGYEHGELIGKHVSVVNAPSERTPEERAAEIIESLNENGTWSGEIQNIKKDGETFWCDASVSTFDHREHGEVWVSVHTDVTESKRAEEALRKGEDEARRLAQENAVLAEIGRIVNSSLDVNAVYKSIAEQVHDLIPFDRISIATADLEAGALVLEYVAGIELPIWRTGDVVPLSESSSRTTINTKKPQLTGWGSGGELRPWSLGEQLAYKAGLRSGISVPIVYNDEVIGDFILRSTKQDAYSQRDLLLAERIATQIAGAIANARLHGHLQRDAREREVLAEMSRIIGSSLNINEVYASFAEQVRKIIPFDRISITTIDVNAGTLTHPYLAGIEVPGWEPGIVLPLADSATEMLVRTRSHLIIGEEAIEEVINRFPCIAAGFDEELRSMLAVPLISNNIVIGSLQFRSRSPNEYSECELALADRVANQIAGAIANAQLHAAIQHDANEREVLAEIGRIISSTLDIDQVYERFADQVHKLIPFDRIVISRIDVERDSVAAAYMSGVEVPGLDVHRVFPLAGTADEMMVRTRSSVVDGAESPEAFSARFPTLAPTIAAGLRSLLAVPLISNDELIGTMILRSTDPSVYAATEVTMAERVSAQIAEAIANAQLHGDLKRVEKALRESERRIKELAAATVRAHEEERQWSAIEVHDRISQPLAGLFHELQSLESITIAEPQAREVAQRASVLLQEAIRECRNIMDALYPAGLDEFGLVALLDAELSLFERDTGCGAQFDNHISVVVPKDVGVALYRIFHEALNNIRRHAASANNVIVSVAYEAQALSLYVQDDGPGFDVEAAMDGQRVSGLISMSRRAEIIGGICEIESAPGRGTAVKVRVPMDASNL